MKRFLIYTKVLPLVGIIFMAGAVFAQDLGSSNTLFGSKKKPAASPLKNFRRKKSSAPAAKKAPAKTTAKPAKLQNHHCSSQKPRPAPKYRAAATKDTPATAKNAKPAAAKKYGRAAWRWREKALGAKEHDCRYGNAEQTGRRSLKIFDPPARYDTHPGPGYRWAPAASRYVQPQPKNDVVITVGQPTSGEFNELFERAIDEGNTARDERNYVRAEGAYLRAQSLKTGDARAVYGLGNLYSDQQRWEEAERAYRTAMKMDPSSPESYIALSFVLTQPIPAADLAERYEEAEKIARRAIQLDQRKCARARSVRRGARTPRDDRGRD